MIVLVHLPSKCSHILVHFSLTKRYRQWARFMYYRTRLMALLFIMSIGYHSNFSFKCKRERGFYKLTVYRTATLHNSRNQLPQRHAMWAEFVSQCEWNSGQKKTDDHRILVQNSSHNVSRIPTRIRLRILTKKLLLSYTIGQVNCFCERNSDRNTDWNFDEFRCCLLLQQNFDWIKMVKSRSERGYLVRILASHPGVPGSNPIAAPKSLVMD